VESKRDWILSTLLRQRERENENSLISASNPVLKTLTGDILIELDPTHQSSRGVQLSKPRMTKTDNNIIVKYNKSHTKEEIIDAAEEALRKKAKEYLPQRVALLAKKYRFRYNKVYIKKNRTNWGSCSSLGNINLNIHLMRLPEELCDYVIIHELAHLIHRNHGREFHNLLDNLTDGKGRTLSSTLRKYNPVLS
jgi:predicted metal-dependent hydrolase